MSSEDLHIALKERVKELKCLYELASLLAKIEEPLESVLRSVSELLPPAFQYPEIAVVRIKVGDMISTTEGFRESAWVLVSDIAPGNSFTGSIEVFYLEEKPELSEGPFLSEERKLLDTIAAHLAQYIVRRSDAESLHKLEWMVSPGKQVFTAEPMEYGDLSELNQNGIIKSSVDREQLVDIASDYLTLLDSSAAIYELNGDYALGLFASGWCRLLDSAARKLCDTDSNEEALRSGKWLCHESCWKDASLKSITEGKPVDIKCNGGINIYAVPVRSYAGIIGSINFGYGDPPSDETELRTISDRYKVPIEELRRASSEYLPRPRFITDLAKRRIEMLSGNLGKLVDLKQSRDSASSSMTNLRTTLNSIGDAVIATDRSGHITMINPVACQLTGWKQDDAIGQSIERVFNIVNTGTGGKVENPVHEVISTGKIVGLANHTKLISKSGQEYQISDSGAPIIDDSGHTTGVVLVFRDITEKYVLEEEIRESERQLARAQSIGNIGSWTFYFNTGEITASDEAFRIYGLNKDQPYTISDAQEIPLPEDRPRLDSALKALMEGRAKYDIEFRIRRKSDGEIRYIHSLAEYNKRENYVSGVIQDITERYQAEEELKKSEHKYRLMADNSVDCIWQLDRKLRFTYLSPSLYDITGFKPEEWIGTRISKHTTWIEFMKMSRLALKMLASYKTFTSVTFETRMFDKAGELIPLEIASTPLIIDGKLEGLQGSTRDIRNRTEAEHRLRESEEKNRFLFENMVQGVIVHSSDGKIIEANRAASKILGLSHDQLMGKTSMDSRWRSIREDGSDYPGSDHPVMVTLKTLKPVENAIMGVFIPEEEAYRWIHINSIPRFVEGSPGRIHQVLVTIEDITALRSAVERAEESDRLKSAFLANMSHEIRTPMNGIIGFTNLLREPDITPDQQTEYIEIIQKSGERMLSTVNDLIDISRIETGQVKLVKSPVSIKERVVNLYNFFRLQASQKGIELTVSVNLPKGYQEVITDSGKFDSILSNLIRNAIKYTDSGTIDIVAKPAGDFLEFFVRDTGIGIARDQKQQVFSRFVQADNSNTRTFEGSGLGLPIAKAYVEMLGGEIWFESEPGKGSVFYFTIPVTKEGKTEEPDDQASIGISNATKQRKLRVLIAEDDEPSYLYLSKLLSLRLGCEILRSKTGRGTVEIVRNSPDIDLVLMDIKMSDHDGYEATRQIREFNDKVVIIAQTAYAMEFDREKAIAAGCNDYISKPVRVDEILNLIREYTGSHL